MIKTNDEIKQKRSENSEAQAEKHFLIALLPLLILVTLTLKANAQDGSPADEDGTVIVNQSDLFRETPYPTAKDLTISDFGIKFSTTEDRSDYKKLREYLGIKQQKQRELLSKLKTYDNFKQDIQRDLSFALSELSTYRRIQDTIKEETKPSWLSSAIQQRVHDSITDPGLLIKDDTALSILSQSLFNVNADIDDANRTLDEVLNPEYRQQSFKTWISAFFAALVAILIVAFFIVIGRKDKPVFELLKGDGLQFITLFVLIIAIILFGILNILEGKELAAILSGIAGYILGRGTSLTGQPQGGQSQGGQPHGGQPQVGQTHS